MARLDVLASFAEVAMRRHYCRPTVDMKGRIDIKNAKPNIGSAGFSYEERGKFSELLAAGFVDSFRELYPDAKDAYSWWSYMGKAREKNVGWRIDYFLITEELKKNLADSKILSDVMGSDHCPVELILNFSEENA